MAWSNKFVRHFIYKISSFYYFLERQLTGLDCKIITELILFSRVALPHSEKVLIGFDCQVISV